MDDGLCKLIRIHITQQDGSSKPVKPLSSPPPSRIPYTMPKYKSRKYIDLILKASSKWGTLEPFSRKIEVFATPPDPACNPI